MYYSLIQSELEYASNSFVGNLSVENLQKLVKLSKSAMRAAFGAKPWHSSLPLMDKLHIMPLENRYFNKTVLFTFRCVHSLASSELCSIFFLRSNCQAGRITRGMQDFSLVLPQVSTVAGTSALSFFAADRWNMLPTHIRY